MRVVMRRHKGAPERFDAGAESVKAKENGHALSDHAIAKEWERASNDMERSVHKGTFEPPKHPETAWVHRRVRDIQWAQTAAEFTARWWKDEL